MQLPDTRWSDRLFLVLAVGAALFALFMHYGIAKTSVSRAEWAKPAKHIQKHFRKGDAVAILPHWALMGAEKLNGLPVLYAEHLANEDLSRYRRLWVLVAPRLGKWWFRHAFKGTLSQMDARYWQKYKDVKSFGKLELYLYKLPYRPALFDFLAKNNLRKAEVGLEKPVLSRRETTCKARTSSEITWMRRWNERRGRFMGKGRYFFGRIIQEIDNTPRDCLWAQPKRCQVLRVRYKNVPLTGRLKIGHGFTTPTPGRGLTPSIRIKGAGVELALYVEEQFVAKWETSMGKRWRDHWIDLSKWKFAYKKGTVEFRIQTPMLSHSRTGYCFQASLRKNDASQPKVRIPAARASKTSTPTKRPVKRAPANMTPVQMTPLKK